ETENGVAGVRGTEFRIEVARDQADLVRVYEGLVQVDARERGWSHSLQAGTELRFRREAEPPRPFDAESEKGHRFMEWVRSRRTREGGAARPHPPRDAQSRTGAPDPGADPRPQARALSAHPSRSLVPAQRVDLRGAAR